MRYLITNHWAENLGDIAILQATIQHIESIDKYAAIVIESSDPTKTKLYFPDYKIVERIFTLKKLHHTRTYHGLNFAARNISFLFTVFCRILALNIFRVSRLNPLGLKILYEYRDTDMVIAAGGDYLSQEYAYFLRFMEFKLAKRLNKPVILYAHSIGPFKNTNVNKVKKYLNKCELILARDKKTYMLLKEYGVTSQFKQTADTVISLAPTESKRANSYLSKLNIQSNTVGIVIRDINYSGIITEKYSAYISETFRLVQHIQKTGGAVTLIAPNGADKLAAIKFNKQYKIKLPIFETELLKPSEVKYLFTKLQLLVSARMHPIIVASSAQTPVLAVAKEFKTYEYMRLVNMQRYCIGIEDITEGRLIEMYEQLRNDNELKSKLNLAVANALALSMRNKKYLATQIDRMKSKNKVLIVTHSTAIEGAVDKLEKSILSNNVNTYKLAYPLNLDTTVDDKLYKNGKVLSRSKRIRIRQIGLLHDLYKSTKTIKEIRPRVYVGANSFDTLPAIFYRIILRRQLQTVVHYASDFSENRYSITILNYIYKFVEMIANNYSDIIISNTYRAENARLKLGLLKARSIVIPNSAELSNTSFRPKKIDTRHFIYIGSITPGHGLYEFILHNSTLIDKLEIIGTGPDLNRVLELAAEKNVATQYHGIKTQAEVQDYLLTFQGVGLATYNLTERHVYYGSSLKLVEYIVAGVPPLTTATTELAEYVRSENLGIVCDTNDFKLVSKNLKTFQFNNYHLKAKKFYSKFKQESQYKKIAYLFQ